MLLTRVRTHNFLTLDALDFDLNRRRTIVTGQNNVGKSTVLAAVSLAIDALGAAADGNRMPRFDAEWSRSGHRGKDRFEVRVGLDFAEDAELFEAFLRAAWCSLLHPLGQQGAIAAAVGAALGPDAAEPLTRGEVVVSYDGTSSSPWFITWEFGHDEPIGHVRLVGSYSDHIEEGPSFPITVAGRAQGELLGSTNDIVDRIRNGFVSLELGAVLSRGMFPFLVDIGGMGRALDDVQVVMAAAGASGDAAAVRFAEVLSAKVHRGLVVTPNHRSAPRLEFAAAQLHVPATTSDGSMLGAELHRLKNGRSDERALFVQTQALFEQLTGQRVDVVVDNLAPHVPDGPEQFLVSVVLSQGSGAEGGDTYDVPLRRSGAGDTEALYLALALADPSKVVLLDEPAVHLSPTAQRRLHSLLRGAEAPKQVVLVTHSPDMVPVGDDRDVATLVRLSRRSGGVCVDRLGEDLAGDRSARLLMTSSHARAVLFAAGVVLVEGETDAGLVDVWTSRVLRSGARELPTLGSVNVAVLAVGGGGNFAAYVGLLQALRIPFALLTDGPVLRPRSKPARSLANRGLHVPTTGDVLADVRDLWEREGVFTLAEDFGDDGSKAGEVEAFMERVDAAAYRNVAESMGASKGLVVGSAFGHRVPAPPVFAATWERILEHLDVI